MRFNEKEMRNWAKSNVSDKEGRLNYKAPKEGYKERWFKLCGNLLFYFRTTDLGSMASDEAMGVLVLENIIVQAEPIADRPFVFSVAFAGERDKHLFSGQTSQQCQDWVVLLKCSSFRHIQNRVNNLRERIIRKSGKDPFDDQGHVRRKAAVSNASVDINLNDLTKGMNPVKSATSSSIHKPTRPAPVRPASTAILNPSTRAMPSVLPTVPSRPQSASVPPVPSRPAPTVPSIPRRPAPVAPSGGTRPATVTVPLPGNPTNAPQNILDLDDLFSVPSLSTNPQKSSKVNKDLFPEQTGRSSFLTWEKFE